MFQAFKNYISDHIQVSDDDFDFIESFAVFRKLRKKQYLLQQGDVCRYNCFIAKGLMRTYSVDDKGTEHIIRFAMENWWISDRESLATAQPTKFNIDAIEDSELILFEKNDFEQICEKIPAFSKMIADILNRGFIVNQNRIHEAISSTAEERYQNFVKRYPGFALRVPQAMIASYLGIKPETLSRLRNPKTKS
ncbi:Crp/Fnr family transcriptional regulator [Flavobacterium sp. MAH-1]|uniref:Crp/Fnr family transcriptional regulator n=1 Tax=Flavobacterium agri TaxID=2743471 RepID=A0A7Y8Y323_9FLAO|nr:Crp/Fnr family transcriptional regulator [Flavobacterium agri]NUY80330.1 Crp/Fnr family transcriptional regulator [Flavobacterium agri]NYA70355.1 Crp/Fnr family transcriptional regulator [Flavobacterium agri]